MFLSYRTCRKNKLNDRSPSKIKKINTGKVNNVRVMQRNLSLVCMKMVKDFPEIKNVRNLPQKHADSNSE